MKKLFIIIFWLIGISLNATTYYVKTGGNDASAGTTDGTAWAHHPWMSTWTGTVVLVPGDVVSMNRGDTWTIANPVAPYMTVAQSGTSGNYITTTAYGSGARPIINISTATSQEVIFATGKSFLIFDNLNVTHHSSTYAADEHRTAFYLYGTSSPCHDIIITNCEINNTPWVAIYVCENAYNIIVGDTTALQTATTTLYSNNIHDFGYGGVMLFGVNPTTNESNFKVYYNYIHDATRAVMGDNEYGIAFSASSSSSNWPKYSTARYNRVEDIITWEGIDIHGGSYCYILDNYVYNCRTPITVFGTTTGTLPTTCDHYYIERNIIEEPGTTASTSAFIYLGGETTNAHGTNYYVLDNIIFYTTIPAVGNMPGIMVGNIENVIISGNRIYDSGSGEAAIRVSDHGGTYGNRNLTITANYIKNWGPSIRFLGAMITGTINVINNIINLSKGNPCLSVITSDIPSGGTLNIYNNTFIGDDYRVFRSTFGIATGGSVIAKNNIFGFAVPVGSYNWEWVGTVSGTFICDNNIYWNNGNGTPFYIYTAAHSFVDWQGHGYDTHSLNVTDPLFKNYSFGYKRTTDFDLQSTSPAIGAGTNVGLTKDYFGHKLKHNPPDIGAIEYKTLRMIK